MRLPRISIMTLMVFVVVVGVGLAALARPNNGWATALSTFVLATLPTSLLGVILRRGPTRAGWVGFAVFGGSFFGFVIFLTYTMNSQVHFDFRWSLIRLQQALEAVAALDGAKVDELLIVFGREDYESRGRVALSLMGLTFALVGSRIARVIAGPEIPPA